MVKVLELFREGTKGPYPPEQHHLQATIYLEASPPVPLRLGILKVYRDTPTIESVKQSANLIPCEDFVAAGLSSQISHHGGITSILCDPFLSRHQCSLALLVHNTLVGASPQ